MKLTKTLVAIGAARGDPESIVSTERQFWAADIEEA